MTFRETADVHPKFLSINGNVSHFNLWSSRLQLTVSASIPIYIKKEWKQSNRSLLPHLQHLYRLSLLFHAKSLHAFLISFLKSACKSWTIAPQNYLISSRPFEAGSFILTPLTGAYTCAWLHKRHHKHILLKFRIHGETWRRDPDALRLLWVPGCGLRRCVTQQHIAAWTWASVFTQEVQVWVRSESSANWASHKHSHAA